MSQQSIYALDDSHLDRDHGRVPRTKTIPVSSIAKTLGRVIQARRRALEITQEDLVAKTGLDISFLSRVERGATSPSVPVLIHLAKSLETTASILTAEVERLLTERRSVRSGKSRP